MHPRPLKATERLPAEQRRAAIIAAVRRVFAERGFHGSTTRALAAAAGVSEALLFKYFPDKESLFSAMQLACGSRDVDRYERLEALEPSPSTLVLMVHFLVSVLVRDGAAGDDERASQDRLALRSLAEDGEFARLLLRPLASRWAPKVEQCLAAAVAAGDAAAAPFAAGLGGLFVHNLAAMIRIHRLPAKAAVDYGADADGLVEQVVWFALRGLGLKDRAIRRDYNPRALALFE
jgi:AcrR family transcriptional regulator